MMINNDGWLLLAICFVAPIWVFLATQLGHVGNFFDSYDDQKIRQWLVREISQKGGTVREVRRLYAISERLFAVEFTDEQGETFHTKCKVDLRTQRLIWSTDPSDLMPTHTPRLDKPHPSTAVLEHLHSPLRHERLTAVFDLAKFDELPPEVYALLARMAIEDDYPVIRAEAKAIARRWEEQT
jgi:AraC-like DNA-binding protein